MRPFRLFLPLACIALFSGVATAQEKFVTNTRSSCSRDSALTIIDQQIDLSKTIDGDSKRINLLIRAADLMWPIEQDKARATFTDAFDVASRLFKEKGAPDSSDGRMRVQGTDFRYTVIGAIAKRDSAWARKLSKQLLDEEAEAAKEEAEGAKEKAQNKAQATRTSERLMGVAIGLIATDQQAAVQFARTSFGYPATIYLPLFFFKLWETNRGLADQFYLEVLRAYGPAPMDQLLYLSSYPFAVNREIGEMPMTMFYALPNGIAPNPALQRMFVVTLLARANDLIKNPPTPIAGTRWTENSQVFMALSRIEPLIANSLPDLAPQVAEARGNIAALLTQPEQQRSTDTMKEPPKQTFDEIIESAEKSPDPANREGRISLAILNAAQTGNEPIEKLEAAGMKIENIDLRRQVMSLAYFYRSQRMLMEKKLDEARRLAAKVEEADQRAYLYAQVANELLKQNKNDAGVRDMLEEVVDAVSKAPDTEVKARATLVVVHLYSTVDPNRAVALLGEVIKTINRIESIDLTGDRINKKIEGKAFGTYRGLQTPGFSPEIVFREMGKLDFDGTLYLASNLSDKSIRGMTTLSLADQCLKDLPPPPKPNPNKPGAAKPR